MVWSEADIKVFVRNLQSVFMFKNGKSMLEGYTHADIRGDFNSKKSTSDFVNAFVDEVLS